MVNINVLMYFNVNDECTQQQQEHHKAKKNKNKTSVFENNCSISPKKMNYKINKINREKKNLTKTC